MGYIIGIDTGGTNTDCALLDSSTKETLCTGKAFTTRENLELGISASLDQLDFSSFKEVKQISLSTTLATNSIVEGRGCETGILLIGSLPDRPLPSTHCALLSGKLDIRGREKQALCEGEIISAVRKMQNMVEAVAVSGYASVRNPAHELKVREIVERTTDLPVFCAHELTGSLGFWERTVTAALNASLIKIIRSFITAAKNVLRRKGINAPLLIVRSDGSLMSEAVALERPVETVLSGPAASILGARHLIKSDDAYIFDMGGTTSDIADLTHGRVSLSSDGARVGGWLTRCSAAEVSTHGIGGDSLIAFPAGKKITAGPERVIPLCVEALSSPHLEAEIAASRSRIAGSGKFQAFDCFKPAAVSNASPASYSLSDSEKSVMAALAGSAHTLNYICSSTGIEPGMLPVEPLLHKGCLQHISFTPTDLVHITGQYTQWDRSISVRAAECIADLLELAFDETVEKVRTAVIKKLVFSCLQSAADFEKRECSFSNDPAAVYLLEKAFSNKANEFLHASFKLGKPLVAVGAPVAAWIPYVAEKLHTKLIIPEHSEAANAIGAAVAPIRETGQALIRPSLKDVSFVVFLPDERREFADKDAAASYAADSLKKYIEGKMALHGLKDCPVEIAAHDIYTEIFTSGSRTYIETRISAESVSDPVIV